MAGLLFALHPLIVVVLFVTAIPTALVRSRYARILYRWQRRRTPWERQSRYLGWLLTTDLFAKEIRLFNLGPFFSQWYQRLRQQLYQERLSITARSTVANFFSQGLAGLFVFGIYAYLVYQALQEQLTLGDLVLYHQALQRGQSNLKGLFSSVSGLDEDNLFLANLFEFFALKPRVKEPLIPEPVPSPLHRGVEFQDVDFHYPGTTRLALNQISFKVRPGETIALVGENGSGKTTLIKLLCRLYDPTAGTITLDGIDLRQFATPDLRRHISVIFQFLIAPQNWLQVQRVLEAEGYWLRWEEVMSPAQQALYFQSSCEYTYLSADGNFAVEPHWNILPRRFWIPLDFQALGQAPTSVQLLGQPVATFSPEATLLILCLNGTKDRWRKLKLIGDVAGILQTHPALDWDCLLETVTRSGCQRLLFLGLLLAKRLLATPLPDSIGQAVQADPVVQALAAEVMAGFKDPARVASKPVGISNFSRWDLKIRERWPDKIGYCWNLLVAPNEGDAAWLELPPSLYGLYSLLRPLRLLARQVKALVSQFQS